MRRRWGLSAISALCGVLLAVTIGGTPGIVLLVLFLALALVLSPRAFPKSITAVEAQRLSAVDGRPIVYWRPGCPYCLRLRTRLGAKASRAHWVDIWQDPEGAAAVRAVADGNETVPTVFLAGESYVNPDPAWLTQNLR
jgi:mycoredoxin